jgi:DNA-binding GntR family transcriptional regulator
MPVPATARPVIPRRLHKDAVFDHLLAAVFDGTLSPGERLRDVDLERWLGVSRTPIRVALAKLGDLRLVETTSKRATRVVVPCAAEAADLFATACAMVAAEADGLVAASDDPDRARLAAELRVVAASGAGAEGAGAAGRLAELVAPMADALDRGLSGGLAAERLRLVGLPLRHHLRALPPGLPTGLARALDLAAAAVERGDAPGVVEAARLAAAAAVASFPTSAPGARGVVGPGREPGVVGATEVTAASFRAPRLLSDDVHDALLKVVLDGTLGPGERLVDDELIAWLGVSRTPIRAALERLSDVGVVELAANRYTRVARPDRASFEEARRLCSGLLAWSALRGDPSASAVGPLDRPVSVSVAVPVSVAVAPRDVALPDGSEPITLAAFSWLMRQARRVALVPQVGALAREVDRLEPRLAHAVVASQGRLRPGAWQAFERASGVAGGPDGRRRAEAVRGLLASIDIEAVEPQ